jgi:hypothetical protein
MLRTSTMFLTRLPRVKLTQSISQVTLINHRRSAVRMFGPAPHLRASPSARFTFRPLHLPPASPSARFTFRALHPSAPSGLRLRLQLSGSPQTRDSQRSEQARASANSKLSSPKIITNDNCDRASRRGAIGIPSKPLHANPKLSSPKIIANDNFEFRFFEPCSRAPDSPKSARLAEERPRRLRARSR